MKSYPENIRALREDRGLSQTDLAKRCRLPGTKAVTSHYIHRIEAGKQVPRIVVLEKIAHGLGVPLWRLFADEDEVRARLLSLRSGVQPEEELIMDSVLRILRFDGEASGALKATVAQLERLVRLEKMIFKRGP